MYVRRPHSKVVRPIVKHRIGLPFAPANYYLIKLVLINVGHVKNMTYD